MAVIDKKLIRFRKLTDFQTRLTAGDIKLTSIVFIEDAKRIWAQGNYYYCPEKIQWSDIVGVPTDLGSLGITDVYTKDESDALYLNINGTAVAAQKLAEPVNIIINGAVTGTVEFDGTKDVAITTTVNHIHDQYENQNAFSIIKVGNTQVNADLVQDSVELVAGDNVQMSASGDKITISATDTTYNLASNSANGLMSASDKSKLDGIAEDAEVNVQSDWNNTDTNSDAYIKNKPTLSTVAISGSYNDLSNKPTIPSAVTESTVSGWGFTKNLGTYSKPSGGIPKTDLASAVQTSLDKADTALQSYTETDPVFKASAAANITSANITSWNGKQDASLKFTDKAASIWVSDSTYADYPYRCDIACAGVTASMYAEVTFNMEQATSGNYAPICETKANVVSIWSKDNTSITVPSIVITK